MQSLIQFKKTTLLFLIPLGFACFAVSPMAETVSPSPDGCYPGFTTAEGCNALVLLTTGAGNTGVGWYSLFLDSSGSYNTGLGAGALALNNADSNTGVGAAALLLNTAGTQNVAVGTNALVFNDSGSYNNAVGAFALYNNIDGSDNNAFGDSALTLNIHANSNTAIGDGALYGNDFTGNGLANGNTAVGAGTLNYNTDASGNTALGFLALLFSDQTGNGIANNNTAIGYQALENNVDGSDNTALGANAGTDPGIVSNNIYVGDLGSGGDTNLIAIGALAASGTPYDNCFIGGIATQPQVTDGTTVCEVSVRLADGRLGIDCTHPSNPGSAPSGAPRRHSTPQQPSARPAVPNGTVGQVEKLEATVAQQQRQIETLTAQLKEQAAQFTAQLKEQAAQIQKVSVQLELNKPAPQTVLNNR